VYVPILDSVFVTSNRYCPSRDSERPQIISISKLTRSGPGKSWQREALSTDIAMGNGGVNYQNGVLFCDQGNLELPGGLVYMEAISPFQTTPILEHYHGRIFNSINDVVVHSDGSIWFTDPCYGWKQGFRPVPTLPNQVYRFDRVTGDVKPVAWGFKRPNGLCFSPDEKTMYITDTGAVVGGGEIESTGPRNIFAFDVMTSSTSSNPVFLGNRRLFAMADSGIPDGIKCDTAGNVYSGCGDGVNVWNPDGVLIGKILVEGGVANFCFGKAGEIFILNQHKFWVARLHGAVEGALLAGHKRRR